MNVLVLAALTEATGNAVTATRIAKHLETDHKVTLADANTATNASLRERVADEKIDVAIGVHALLAGPFLRGLGLPFALVFGGTDLYEPVHELQQSQMARAVVSAARLLAFSPENRARAEWMWPSVAGHVSLLPQAVELPAPTENFSLRARLGLPASDVMVLLPTGIRRVKDPLHVVEALGVWHALQPRVHLVVVGAVIEPDYADEALIQLSERPGVHYVSALSRTDLLAAMREADVVLNTSISEGMCGTVLEAMALGTPVVVRRNAGNESLVAHGHTGLLYDAPGELVHWIASLSRSHDLRHRLAETARHAIETHHTVARERDAYLGVARDTRAFGRTSVIPALSVPADELDVVVPVAERVGIDAPVIDALRALVTRVRSDAELARVRRELSGLLGTAPPSVAITETRRHALERTYGRDTARTFYLLLALAQVPAAEARHAARAIDPAVTRATLGDLALWSRLLLRHGAGFGISLETLAWAQRYLRGELLQFGSIQLDLRPFPGPMHVHRHRSTGELSAVSLDGRRMDLSTGAVCDDEARPHPERDWQCIVEPGTPMLELWIPGNSLVTLPDIATGLRDAYATFRRLAPETVPVGVYGESWRLDPQVLDVLPLDLGIHALQSICALYPSALSESKTLRRLFGPDATRALVAAMDLGTLDPMRRAMVELLRKPDVTLRARCGLVLRDAIERLPEWS